MSSILSSPRAVLTVLVPILLAYLYGPSIRRGATVLGAFRTPENTLIASPDDIVFIDDTVHCEDVHYYAPSHSLFTACEDSEDTRFAWFPPLATFTDPALGATARGSIHVVDPDTKKSRRLSFENFDGPFITHGIDVITDPESKDGSAVYIFAVNHVPGQEYLDVKKGDDDNDKASKIANKAASRIEIFHHTLGSSSARHIRTVQHPLIATPNDIVAVSPTSFYVTNDHHYREGHLRLLEDVYSGATWSTVIHVRLLADSDSPAEASVAVSGLHNNNGLGHGRTPDEILVGSCCSGVLHVGTVPPPGSGEAPISLGAGAVSVDSIIDNPSYFSDPFAGYGGGGDASGFVLPGLSRAVDLQKTCRDPAAMEPIMVWYARPPVATTEGDGAGKVDGWETRLLFEDDGERMRSASAAVLIAIDPEKEGGKRKAWLFVTGFLSRNMIAVKVDL